MRLFVEPWADFPKREIWKLTLIGVLGFLPCLVLAGEAKVLIAKPGFETAHVETDPAVASTTTTEVAIEAADADAEDHGRDWPYLGIATKEASEALAAQLGLQDGAGLVVTYVTPESPSAKAGLQKHDVLVRLGEQALVHPAQLRKLVHVHKPNDVVELAFYRAGKQQTTSVTLGSVPARISSLGDLPTLERRIEESGKEDEERSLDQVIHDSLGHLNKDRKGLHREIHRSMEEVREAIKEALLDLTNVASNLDPVRNVLRELNRSGVQVDKKATVTVRSAGKGVKSVVKADDSGTIVLVQNPKIHLTAHDKEGNLLFDGEIETQEQRAKVSSDLWERVEPLMEKMTKAE